MKTKTKICLITATSLIIIGAILFTVIMSTFNWDFSKLSTTKYQTNEYEITNDFSNISINSKTGDIFLNVSTSDTTKVVCYEEELVKHSVNVVDNTLTIQVENYKKWYHYIGFNFKTPRITIYLPKTQYDNLKIKNSTGDIEILSELTFNNADISLSTGDVDFSASSLESSKITTSTGDITIKNASLKNATLTTSSGDVELLNVTAKDISIKVSTGETELVNVKCENLTSSGTTGDITLENVIASKNFNITTTTGDVEFDKCDAKEIYVKTTTGDVEGSIITSKTFIVKTTTGEKNYPETTTGGKCEITTTTGDVKITVKKLLIPSKYPIKLDPLLKDPPFIKR